MGIDANVAYHIARSTRALGLTGAVCTLGVVTEWANPGELDRAILSAGLQPSAAKDPFLRMGFQSVESTDVSDFEGCTHVLDLNAAALPQELSERYDVIYNGGTLEHVFDIRGALKNIFQMLRPGGVVIQLLPVNGWVDHGFYQFSPTFLVDYYIENSFELLDARLMRYQPSRDAVTVYPYVPGSLDAVPDGAFTDSWLCYGVARKTERSTWDRIPKQGRYVDLHGEANRAGAASLSYFLPYRIVGGELRDIPVIHIKLPEWRAGEGHELLAHIPQFASIADDVGGQVSPLMLMESGRFVGPPHALHDEIRRVGKGAYSHWGEWLHFSAGDNGSPEEHVYECVVPDDALQLMSAVDQPRNAKETFAAGGGVLSFMKSLGRKKS